jgi:hypothetical protein
MKSVAEIKATSTAEQA